MKIRRMLALCLCLCMIISAALAAERTTFRNPVAATGNDPWVVQHEGKYYYCYSTDYQVGVSLIADPTLLQRYNTNYVYTAPNGTNYSKCYWAPELHYIQGEWYIYVAASAGNDYFQRMFVLKGTSQDPTDPFVMMGQITDPSDQWAIDGTVLQYKDELYFVWSGWYGEDRIQQNLYLAHMSDPCTIDSERVMLSFPGYEWERMVFPVNEGPAGLVKGDTLHVIYSASACWDDYYCLGLLTYRPEQGDIMDPDAWIKSDSPVFSQVPTSYAPGHCSFIQSPDGTEDYIVYHANRVSHTGIPGRSVRMQKFTWDGDMPVFGEPLPYNAEAPLPSGM